MVCFAWLQLRPWALVEVCSLDLFFAVPNCAEQGRQSSHLTSTTRDWPSLRNMVSFAPGQHARYHELTLLPITLAAHEVFKPSPRAADENDNITHAQRLSKELLAQTGMDEAGLNGIDAVVDCSGAEICLQTGICAAKPGGVIAAVGMGKENVSAGSSPAVRSISQHTFACRSYCRLASFWARRLSFADLSDTV